MRQITPNRFFRREIFLPINLFAFLALCVVPSLAQIESETLFENWRWTTFTTESGLPSNHILGIYETTSDIPWVLTTAGLAWYDGYRWNALQDTLGFLHSNVSWVCPGLDGCLLVISNRHAFKVDTSSIEMIAIPDRYETEQLNALMAIVPLGVQSYMFMNSTSLFVLEHRSLHPVKLPGAISSPPFPPLHYTGGEVWLCCTAGLCQWNGSEMILKLKSNTGNFEVVSLVRGSKGEMLTWVKTPFDFRGLWEWSNERTPVHNTREGNELIETMDISPSGNALALYESGNIRMRGESGWQAVTSVPPQLKNALVLKYRKNGDLWAGTESGLFLYRGSSQRWTYWKHPFPNLKNTIHAIIRSHEGLFWLATGEGVEVRRPDGTIVREFDEIDGKSIPIVTGMAEDASRNIWISSGSQFDGAYRWNGVSWKHYGKDEGLDAPRIHSIVPDRDGRLWFLGLSSVKENPEQPGAFILEGDRFLPWTKMHGLPNKRVYAFAESRDGSLWFGTSTGLVKWHVDHWKNFQELSNLTVFAIAVDSSGRVWFGSNSESPLGFVDEQDSVHLMPMTDRHILSEIWDLDVDTSGTLWIATRSDEGVVSYRDGTWSSIHLSAGLTSLKLWPLLPANDRLYIGTDGGGVDILRLDELHSPLPRIDLYDPLIEENAASLRWNIHTYWGALPEWEAYSRYKLDDLSWSDWSATREEKFSDLSPGTHTIRIQAKGIFGRFDTAGKQAEFFIPQPAYLKPTVVVPVTLLGTAVLYLGILLFVRKRHHALELIQRERNLRLITETTSSAIFIYDESVILYANSGAEKLTGFTKDALERLSFSDIIDPGCRDRIAGRRIRMNDASAPERSHSELQLLAKDGFTKWIDYTWGAIDFEGRPAIIGTAIDITERRRAEEKLLAYQEQLKLLATKLANTEEEERRRMATYLHDAVSQSLAFCQTKLTTLKTARRSPANQKLLREVNRLLEETLENLQTLTFELSPPVLYELPFEDAIGWLAESMEERHKLRVTVTGGLQSGMPELAKEFRSVAFHAVREVLINIVKHAETNAASLHISGEGQCMKIRIEDRGKGFDPAILESPARRKGGFGLFNIRERLTHLGAQFEIHSHPHRGTSVLITIPLGNK